MEPVRLANQIAEKGIRLIDLARAIGVDKASVTRWSQRRVPAERVLDVERITGVPRHELRPDLYPPTPAPQEAAPCA